MERRKVADNRKNLEKLRKKIQTDLKPALPSFISRAEVSEKFSENSSFSIQQYYRFGEKIGQGAHGIVKKAYQIQTGELFAVKILKADEQKIQTTKQNFIMCRVLKHPSIIQHHQLFIDRKKQQVFLIMEHCPYPPLHSVYKTLSSRAQIAHIMKSLLEAVCELHKNGICHRDLKLQNILYERTSGDIKIIDLGISKLIFNRKTCQKQTMWSVTGTLHYKAPEMFQGCQYDQKIDAWALGVIAYQLAYGRLPFSSQFQMGLIQQILRKQPEFEQQAIEQDQLLISFIQGLLKKNSKRRLNCFQALRHPFIKHSQNHTRMSRYQDIFHLDGFSSKISRSNSLSIDENSSRQSSVEGRRAPKLKELTLTIISDCHRNC